MTTRIIPAGDVDLTDNSIAAGDDVIFDRGKQTFTNADLSAPATGDSSARIANIKFGPDFSGHFTADAPLTCGVSGKIEHRGRGTLYLDADSGGNGSPADTIDEVQMLRGANLHLVGSGAFTRVDLRSGVHSAGPSVLLDLWHALGGSTSLIRYNSGDNNLTTMRVSDSDVWSERGLDGATVSIFVNSRVRFFRENPSGATSGVTYPTQSNAGGRIVLINSVLEWEGGDIAGTIEAYGRSAINFANVQKDITVAALVIDAHVEAASVLDSQQDDATVTITSTTRLGGDTSDFPARISGDAFGSSN